MKSIYARGAYRLFQERTPQIILREDEIPAVFIDTSGLVKRDAGTGIQRVSRNLYLAMTEIMSGNGQVIPVWGEINRPGYFEADAVFENGRVIFSKSQRPLRAKAGDIYLDCDHIPMLSLAKGPYLAALAEIGVSINFIVHDLLPILRPEWFTPGGKTVEEAWLKAMAPVGKFICVSQTVKNDAQEWLAENGIKAAKEPAWFYHGYSGAEFTGRHSTNLDWLPDRPTFLVVGTIEPRKGHRDVLAIFEALWAKGHACNLVFAGRYGWKMKKFRDYMLWHKSLGDSFFWCWDCDDTQLGELYKKACGVIMASYGEGFGLPILEAAAHKTPLILRDLPVFREIAGDFAAYFKNNDDLSRIILNWKQEEAIMPEFPLQSWQDAARKLLVCLD